MKWLLFLSAQVITTLLTAQQAHIPLNDGWSFTQLEKDKWYSAEVPGVVHTDLLRHGLIPDPYMNSNVDSVQWIENEDWIYKRSIFVSDTLLMHGHLDLAFKGLDTFAEVYLNDSLIGKADNMFRTWEWPVKRALRVGENELKVILRSPIKEGAKLRDAYGIQLPHDNDPSGVSPYIRKAAYQFGWDFCPRLVTSGIWKGVELKAWSTAQIDHVTLDQTSTQKNHAFSVETGFVRDQAKRGRLKVYMNDVKYVDRKVHLFRKGSDRTPTGPMILKGFEPELWEPRGSGHQSVYQLKVELWRRNVLLDTYQKQVGFRKIELDRSPDSEGSAFSFRVNGKPVFARGCNMIPPDLIPSSISTDQWLELVRQMQDLNMNMVRVWSGGIYPPEEFYAACDTAGILIWQDLMFGNPVPTGDDYTFSNWGRPFLDNALAEVDDVMQCLEHHPSVAIVCGNNELDVAWRNWGWQARYDLHGMDSVRVGNAQRKFFEESLPLANPGILYTPTSPLSNWGNSKGLTEGDLHYWGVWHGDSAFSSFGNNVGRFVSEYGFQSYPDSVLLAKYIDPSELYLDSPAVNRLQRSYKTDKPIWDAIERELGEERPTTLGGFIEASQRAQAIALGLASKAHIAAQPHCMGTLLWQLNDCWPGPSWSIVDFEGRPKPAYNTVQQAFTETY